VDQEEGSIVRELPKGWTNVSLGEAGNIITGNTPSTKQANFYGGNIPFVKPGDMGSLYPIVETEQTLSLAGATQARLLRRGAVLVSCIGNLGKVCIAGVELATNQQINAIEFDNRFVLDRYGFLYCRTLRSWMEKEASATTVSILNKSRFSLAPIPLPPLDEQKRIADRLDILLTRIDKTKAHLDRIPPLLKRFRQSVLAAATSGKLTEDWREANGVDFDDWSYERAADVCGKVQSGGTPREGFIDEAGIPFLKVYNIVDQQVSFEYRPQFILETIHNSSMSKSQAKPGDVLMNIVGPPLGKVAILPKLYPDWNINQAITLFRPSPRMTTGWLYCLLCSGLNIADIVNETRGSAGQSNISLSQCRDFIFSVPPLEEQHEIVRRVETLFAKADRIEAQYQKARQDVDRLTPALLAKAFRGELVPQDPNDEPASVLLERVKADRAKGETVKKTVKARLRFTGRSQPLPYPLNDD
jgi:type I restriction enzyme, S subunit